MKICWIEETAWQNNPALYSGTPMLRYNEPLYNELQVPAINKQ